jgi:tetratricopeptide (TPR) repeat protein
MAVSATPDSAPEASGWEHYYELGRRRFAEGDASGAELAFRDAIAAAETPGGDPLQLASSLSSLGQLKYQQKDYTAAEDCFQRALQLRERALGRDHPVVISGINNLAASYVARGALDEAEPLLQRAMAVTVKRVEATQSELSVNLNNLVRLYVKRGDYARAEPLLVQLLALKRPLGPEHPDVAAVLVTLAKLRFSMGRAADSERLWRRVLAVREKALPPGDLILAGTIDGLADTCAAQNNRVEELELRERAMAIRETALGSAHPSLDPMRVKLIEVRRVVAGLQMKSDATVGAKAAPRAAASVRPAEKPTGTSGRRHPSPIAQVSAPTPIPELDLGTSPTPAPLPTLVGTAERTSIARPAEVPRAPVRLSGPSVPELATPTSVRWLQSGAKPPTQAGAGSAEASRRASRKLNLTRHSGAARSGGSKVLWFVLAIAVIGGGVFVFGRDVWSSVLPPVLNGLRLEPRPATATARAGSPVTTHPATPATPVSANTTPPSATPSAVTTSTVTQSTGPSAPQPPTDSVTPVAPLSGGAPAKPTAPPMPPKGLPRSALPVPQASGAASAAPAATPTSATASTTTSATASATRAHAKPTVAHSAAPAASVPPGLPAVAIPNLDVDAATHSIDAATKEHSPTTTPTPP